jgi:hypothetical protein
MAWLRLQQRVDHHSRNYPGYERVFANAWTVIVQSTLRSS